MVARHIRIIFLLILCFSAPALQLLPPTVNEFAVKPALIVRGHAGFAELRWSVSGADQVSIDQGIGVVSAVGSRRVSPEHTLSYTLTASGPGGNTTRTLTLRVTVHTEPKPPESRSSESPPEYRPSTQPSSRPPDGHGPKKSKGENSNASSDAKNYATIQIFYATDRRPTGDRTPAAYYGDERNQQGETPLALGRCEVSIPRDHRLGEIERPSIWKFEFREDPEKHVVLLSVNQESTGVFYSALKDRVSKSPLQDAFVFVHGYNVTFAEAARRTAQFTYDLGFQGAPILYSWPSQGELVKYTVDEQNVEWTTPHLREFLKTISFLSGAKTVHLICHSMGSRALTYALKDISVSTGEPRFDQLVLTAPDIDADVFKELSDAMCRVATRVTLYASSKDEALAASKKIHGYYRAGESGSMIVVMKGMDTIDASAVDTGLMGHSYFGDNRSVISDLFYLLRDRKPPGERFGMKPRTLAPALSYWVFKP